MEKLAQGQIWKVGEELYRIVEWQRLAIEYKHFTDWEEREGTFHKVSKKEFCKIIRHGELFEPPEEEGAEEEELDLDSDSEPDSEPEETA